MPPWMHRPPAPLAAVSAAVLSAPRPMQGNPWPCASTPVPEDLLPPYVKQLSRECRSRRKRMASRRWAGGRVGGGRRQQDLVAAASVQLASAPDGGWATTSRLGRPQPLLRPFKVSRFLGRQLRAGDSAKGEDASAAHGAQLPRGRARDCALPGLCGRPPSATPLRCFLRNLNVITHAPSTPRPPESQPTSTHSSHVPPRLQTHHVSTLFPPDRHRGNSRQKGARSGRPPIAGALYRGGQKSGRPLPQPTSHQTLLAIARHGGVGRDRASSSGGAATAAAQYHRFQSRIAAGTTTLPQRRLPSLPTAASSSANPGAVDAYRAGCRLAAAAAAAAPTPPPHPRTPHNHQAGGGWWVLTGWRRANPGAPGPPVLPARRRARRWRPRPRRWRRHPARWPAPALPS